jgi:hypothetical protein
MERLEVVIECVVASREIILNDHIPHENISISNPTPISFNLNIKWVGSIVEEHGVLHQWTRFNSHEEFSLSHGVTLR